MTLELSTRQRQVLELAALGLRHKEIARELEISVSSTKLHVRMAEMKLGAKTCAHAVAMAQAAGLLTGEW